MGGEGSTAVAELVDAGDLVINDGYRAKNSELSDEGLPFARAQNITDESPNHQPAVSPPGQGTAGGFNTNAAVGSAVPLRSHDIVIGRGTADYTDESPNHQPAVSPSGQGTAGGFNTNAAVGSAVPLPVPDVTTPLSEPTTSTKHHRRSIRLQGYDYTQSGAYFVTIVAEGRECLFGEIVDGEMHLNRAGRIVQREWERLPRRFPHVQLDAFVVMPNHIHGIIVIAESPNAAGRGTAAYTDDSPNHQSAVPPSGQGAAGGFNADVPVGSAVPLRSNDVVIGRDTADHTDESPNAGRGTADHTDEFLNHQPAVPLPITDTNVTVGSAVPLPITDTDVSVGSAAPQHEQFGKPVPGSIPTIIRSFKSAVTQGVNFVNRTPGATIWQRNYYEHVVRRDASLERIQQYIVDNPENWDDDDENLHKAAR